MYVSLSPSPPPHLPLPLTLLCLCLSENLVSSLAWGHIYKAFLRWEECVIIKNYYIFDVFSCSNVFASIELTSSISKGFYSFYLIIMFPARHMFWVIWGQYYFITTDYNKKIYICFVPLMLFYLCYFCNKHALLSWWPCFNVSYYFY